ncbi:MAG: hypothetical protein Q9213_004314 [Squamulea squamosa]
MGGAVAVTYVIATGALFVGKSGRGSCTDVLGTDSDGSVADVGNGEDKNVDDEVDVNEDDDAVVDDSSSGKVAFSATGHAAKQRNNMLISSLGENGEDMLS